MNKYYIRQTGASLIEVLVAILLLSFGMLSLGGMLSFAVQLPKLSAYRAAATIMASGHVERIRANPDGFSGGNYTAALNESSAWNFTSPAVATSITATDCVYATPCTAATLATKDTHELRNTVRRDLPAGDMILKCSTSPCAKSSFGELWMVWQEPSTFAAFAATSSDNCPSEATTVYNTPAPRCLYVRFKIE